MARFHPLLKIGACSVFAVFRAHQITFKLTLLTQTSDGFAMVRAVAEAAGLRIAVNHEAFADHGIDMKGAAGEHSR